MGLDKFLVAVTVCLAVLVLSMNGTVSSAVNERTQMSEKLQAQSARYDELQQEYDQLQSSYKALADENTKYQDQQSSIDELNTRLSDLQEKYDALTAENASLKSQVSSQQDAVLSPVVSSSGDNGGGSMVWLSETGSKYHSIPDCGNMNPDKARQISQSEAEAQGYSACSKCW